ncbi:MAG: hypothetical protein ACKOGM_07090 [Solirubrobacterales bacterium]
MIKTFFDRVKWVVVLAAVTAATSGGVASAHQGETGPGHHADDPPAVASAQSGASESAGTSADGGGESSGNATDAAPTSAPEEPDPDPTVPLLILAIVLAVGTGWVAWKRRRPERAESS